MLGLPVSLRSLSTKIFMAMSPDQQLVQQIESAKAAWLEGDGQKFVDLFTSDGELIAPGHRWQGRNAILEAFQSFTATHLVQAIAIHNLVVQGHSAMLEWSWEEVEKQTGQVTRMEDAIAIDFRGSLIQRWREYIDETAPPA